MFRIFSLNHDKNTLNKDNIFQQRSISAESGQKRVAVRKIREPPLFLRANRGECSVER